MNAELEKWINSHALPLYFYDDDNEEGYDGRAVFVSELEKLFDGNVLVPEACMNPRLWTKEMHDAWHKNIPDVQAAFAAVLSVSRQK